jgi:hypothetical protein
MQSQVGSGGHVADGAAALETSVVPAVARGFIGGAIVGIIAIVFLAPTIRSLRLPYDNITICSEIFRKFESTNDPIELEREKFLLDRVHCDIKKIYIQNSSRH